MAKNDFSSEVPENYESKCLCVLVLDVSGSMRGNRMEELNKGLQDFYNELSSDETTSQRVEVAIITFGSFAKTIQAPSLVENFSMPSLTADGSTVLVTAVNQAIDLVSERKNWYKSTGQPYCRPLIILMTDGEPDDDQDVDKLAQRIRQDIQNKHYVLVPVGVDGANMDVLSKIQGDIKPMQLQGTKFRPFFKFLSSSVDTIVNEGANESKDIPWDKDIDEILKSFEI